jgi:hypothetical protein
MRDFFVAKALLCIVLLLSSDVLRVVEAAGEAQGVASLQRGAGDQLTGQQVVGSAVASAGQANAQNSGLGNTADAVNNLAATGADRGQQNQSEQQQGGAVDAEHLDALKAPAVQPRYSSYSCIGKKFDDDYRRASCKFEDVCLDPDTLDIEFYTDPAFAGWPGWLGGQIGGWGVGGVYVCVCGEGGGGGGG